jgi:hypothetical protein
MNIESYKKVGFAKAMKVGFSKAKYRPKTLYYAQYSISNVYKYIQKVEYIDFT